MPDIHALCLSHTHTHTLLISTAMVELDGDDVRISSRGKLAERDIVQVKQALALLLCTKHDGLLARPTSEDRPWNLPPPEPVFS